MLRARCAEVGGGSHVAQGSADILADRQASGSRDTADDDERKFSDRYGRYARAEESNRVPGNADASTDENSEPGVEHDARDRDCYRGA